MFVRRRLTALAAAMLLVAAVGPGTTAAQSIAGIDLELPSGETVSGRVADENGAGIPFAPVGLCAGPDDCVVFEGQANANGDYTIRGIEPGTYIARADRPDAPVNIVETGYYSVTGTVTDPALASEITVGVGGTTGIDFSMPSGVVLSGRTLDPEGDPVPGVVVRAFGDLGSGVPITSDASGEYQVVGLVPSSSYSLSVEPPADSPFPFGDVGAGMVTIPESDETQIAVGTSDLGDVDITLTRGNSISGHLDGAAGKAIAVEPQGEFNSHRAIVDGAGNFDVPGLWPGTYQLLFVVDAPPDDGQFPYGLYNGQGQTLADQNESGADVDASGGDVTGLTATVPTRPTISGVVSGETGPLVSARVAACAEDIGCVFMTAPGGVYSFVNLPAGDFAIQAGSHHWVPAFYATLVHVTTSDIGGLDIVLPRGSSIGGRITGPSGEPVVGASVIALPSNGGISEFGPGDATTDANGDYSITGLADDTYRVQVSPALFSGYKNGYWAEFGNGYTDDFEQAGLIVIASAPTILAASPARDATGVARGANVTLHLSADVTGVSKATFQVREARTNRLIPGKVTYSAATDTATFDPTAPLGRRNTYVVTVLAGITDLTGNPLQPTSWTFTTGT